MIEEELSRKLIYLGYQYFNLIHRSYNVRPWCCTCKNSIITGWKYKKVWYHEDCLLRSKTVKKRLEILGKNYERMEME